MPQQRITNIPVTYIPNCLDKLKLDGYNYLYPVSCFEYSPSCKWSMVIGPIALSYIEYGG
jgi:hypothetical protein